MGLVLGTNCGFVTTAPVDDPAGTSNVVMDTTSRALKVIAPIGSIKITEIGWWCDTASQESNFEVGLYDHNSTDNEPENRLQVSNTNAKGTNAGWKRVTGLNWAITAETIYWIAVQLDNTITASYINVLTDASQLESVLSSQTALPHPWGSGTETGRLISIYAVYEATPPAGTNTKINIGDTWKDISAIKVNIGDAWKEVSSAKINIGDTWKTIF